MKSSSTPFVQFVVTALLLLGMTGWIPLAAGVVLGAAGSHALTVVKAGEPYQLVSIPFLKLAVARGRLDGVDPVTREVTDNEGAFGVLPDSARCILLIRDGPLVGAWFLIEPPATTWAASPTRVILDPLRASGSILSLAGDEAFTVHPLFQLAEVIPEDGSVLPLAATDVQAGQVHIHDPASGDFVKYWLSDGTLTGRVSGWTTAVEGRPVAGAAVWLEPGVSFYVRHPAPVVDQVVRLAGEVLNAPLVKDVAPGFNFLGVEFNLSRVDAGGLPSFALRDFGLATCGFRAAADPVAADFLYLFTGGPTPATFKLWLKQSAGSPLWTDADNPAMPRDATGLEPGQGIILWSGGGNGFLWKDGSNP